MLDPRRPRLRTALGLSVLLSVVSLCAAIRIRGALTDPNFDIRSADGLLRSDPALLYYITERIIESGGLPPDDFRADPRIQHPATADIPAMFTVGQEFLVAWAYLALGGRIPLHVLCVWIMGILASLAAVGVYGLTWELTRRVGWAVLAALMYLVLPVNYRTLGLILMREDVSLPCFAVHLWLLSRAARTGRAWSFLAAALAAVAGAASWHAMGFILALEAATLLAWFARTGRNPLAVPRAWIVPAALAISGLAVPVLRSKLFVLSPALQIAFAMLAGAWLEGRGSPTRVRKVAAVLAVLAVLVPISLGVSTWVGGGQADYSHVFTFVLAKLRHLGVPPEDPTELPFEARLLWQGPFVTATAPEFLWGLTAGIPVLALGIGAAARGWLRRPVGAGFLLLGAFSAVSVAAAWMAVRLMILLGSITPVLAAALAARHARPRLAAALLGAAVALQAGVFSLWLGRSSISWYGNPAYNAEVASLVGWARKNLPRDGAVASDFVHSTVLLAHNRNPIVCQPKYETLESRRRFEEYLESYLHGSPEDLARFARRYRCRYLLIDRIGMWLVNRYIAGIPLAQREPAPGTAAAVFMSSDPGVLTSVPGFRLVYRSPAEFGTDIFRLYELEPSAPAPLRPAAGGDLQGERQRLGHAARIARGEDRAAHRDAVSPGVDRLRRVGHADAADGVDRDRPDDPAHALQELDPRTRMARLRGGRVDRTHDHVGRGLTRRPLGLGLVVHRPPDEREPCALDHRRVRGQVQADAQGARDPEPAVDDQHGLGGDGRTDPADQLPQFVVREVLLPDLDDPGAPVARLGDLPDEVAAPRPAAVSHQHQPRQGHAGQPGILSIRPLAGDDGSAWNLRGMRPARNARRPASAASRIARAINTGSRARATAVFSSTASQPSSNATVTSEAVPTPASTTTGTPARSTISSMLCGFRMPSPEPIGAPSGITAAHPASWRRRATTGSSLV
jgi:hypothetical protein